MRLFHDWGKPLNDGTPALYFQAYEEDNTNHWFLTTEKLEELED